MLHLLYSLWPALTRIESDFANYWVPAWSVAHGRPLDGAYEARWFVAEAPRAGLDVPGSFVPQPPANALLLAPLGGLPPRVAKALWSALLAAALFGAWWILRGALGLEAAVLGALFLLSTAATRNALVYGQPYPLLLLCLCLAWRASERGALVAAGLWLSPLLVLKLYGLPFVLALAVSRKRALLGVLLGATALFVVSLALLGWPIHERWLREVLPASLQGRVQDPYSPIWGSVQSLAHRLFQGEPDLNPNPARDWPRLARALPWAWNVFLAGIAVRAGREMAKPGAARRAWAILGLCALSASPLTGSYHFVLLLFPAALLVEGAVRAGSYERAGAMVALTAFATSGITHYFAPLAGGWSNLLAYPRLWALVILLGWALHGRGRTVALAASFGAGAGLLALVVPTSRAPGDRLASVSGYLATEPAFCDGALTWTTLDPTGRLVRRAESGAPVPAGCVAPGTTAAMSPDGRLTAAAEWRGGWLGSWDVVVRDRRTGSLVSVIGGPANETAPTFSPDGRVVFASDWRRGLGATTLFVSQGRLRD